MSPLGPTGLVHSIQARLQNEARSRNRPYIETLELFAVERFLHRLGCSPQCARFVLKGALLLRHWLGADTRPTRDIDLLGPSGLDAEALQTILREILLSEVEEDGIAFAPDTILVAPIRRESPVLGLRAKFDAKLGQTKLRYQVDVGLGDDVFPRPQVVVPGGLLGFPMASLQACTPYTTVAEKLEALVVLGETNSRIKDYYDLLFLPRRLVFEGPTLAESIRRSFARRATAIPRGLPDGLGDAFGRAPLNANRWQGFLDKGRLLDSERPGFGKVVEEIRTFALPPLEAAAEGRSLKAKWPPGGPWR